MSRPETFGVPSVHRLHLATVEREGRGLHDVDRVAEVQDLGVQHIRWTDEVVDGVEWGTGPSSGLRGHDPVTAPPARAGG